MKRANEIGGEVLHIPVCMGAVVPTYNLPGVEQPLRFTPKLLADIFLGHITRWNDPALKTVNPAIDFPDKAIAVVHRSDGSGTTFVWTEYLSKVSPEWKAKVGAATTVPWPVGVGQRGNEGVGDHIAKTPYTLGYNELSTATSKQLQYGWVQNREGVFIRPTLASITAAAEGALHDIPDDLRYTITNMPGKAAYPISSNTWVLVYTNQRPDKGKALVDLLHWVVHDGQQYCDHLQYARLPPGLVERIEKKLAQIKSSK
jgi:phosphate transport system substrate-binding protein